MKRNERLDRKKGQRSLYENNRRRILHSQDTCGICGLPVDKKLKYPDPMCATIDHIIPINKGGTNALENLQLAHFICNQGKSDKVLGFEKNFAKIKDSQQTHSHRNLPQSFDWFSYNG